MNEQQTVTYTFPFLQILTIVFVIFKLTGTIEWSWFWVFSPILIPLVLFIGFLLIIGVIGFLSISKN